MAYAFDTLGYAKRLRDAGVTLPEAEAHAEAARDFVMAELVTRNDLEVAIAGVLGDLAAVRRDLETSIASLRRDLEASVASLRRDLEASIASVRHDLETSVASVRHDLDASAGALREEMAGMRRDFRSALDNMGLRLTVRLGAMIGVGIAALAVVIKL